MHTDTFTHSVVDAIRTANKTKHKTGRALLAATIKVAFSIQAKDAANAASISAGLTWYTLNKQLSAQGLPKGTIVEEANTSESRSSLSGVVLLFVTRVTTVVAVSAAVIAARLSS